MSDDVYAADSEALRGSSRRIAALTARVDRLAREVEGLAVGHPNAAGDGEYRKVFDKKYAPAAAGSQTFMRELTQAVEDFSDGTADVAVVVDETEDSAAVSAGRR